MHLSLNPDIHSCNVSGQVIFLNAKTGRYFCLPNRLETAYLCAAEGDRSRQCCDINELIENGLLVIDAPTPKPLLPTSIELPPEGDLSGCGHRSSLPDIAAAVLAQTFTSVALRANSFHNILRRLEARRQMVGERQSTAETATAERLALAIQATNILVGSTDRCLNRSLALLHLCYRRASAPTFVIGVRTNPFVAHCWVQTGNLVLNDRSEHARLFTRIFAL
jgi:hypothetical protein